MLNIKAQRAYGNIEWETAVLWASCLLASRAGIFAQASPLGMALLAAAAFHNTNVWLAGAFCCAGYVSLLSEGGVIYAAGAAVLTAVFYAFRALKLYPGKAFYAVPVGAVSLIILALDGGTLYSWLTGLLEILIAVLLFFAFSACADVLIKKRGTVLTEEERVCFTLVFWVLTLGSAISQVFRLEYVLALIFTVAAAYIGGAGSGAAVGLATGAALAIAGMEPEVLGLMGVIGAAAGLVRQLKRFAITAAVLLCNLLARLLIPEYALPFGETFIACAAVLATPRRVWRTAAAALDIHAKRERDQEIFARNIKREAGEKLARCASVFEQMADVLGPAEDEQKEELARAAEEAAAAVCPDCDMLHSCWSGNFVTTYTGFSDMVSAVAFGGNAPEWVKGCKRGQDLEAAAHSALSARAEAIALKKRCGDARRLLNEQLRGIGEIVGRLASQVDVFTGIDADLERAVEDGLAHYGIRARNVIVQKRDSVLEITAVVREGLREPGELVLRAAEEACSASLEIAGIHKSGKSTIITLRRAEAFSINCGQASQIAEGFSVCGDSVKAAYLPGGKYMLCLSDGMGNGETAAKESGAAVELIYRLFCAGYEENMALESANRVLMLHGGEAFSTVDLCLFDLVSGNAEFIKVGAAPSYVWSYAGVESILAPALPMGVLNEMRPASIKRKMEDGERIILCSDGFSDCAGEDAEAWIHAAADMDPQDMAEALVSAARAKGAKDDVSVVVAEISSKRRGGFHGRML